MKAAGWDLTTTEVLLIIAWVVAALLRSGPFWIGVMVLTAVALAGRVWGHFGTARLAVRRSFRPARCFLGDPVSLEVEVTNRKILPLPHLSLTYRLPHNLELRSPQGRSQPARREETTHYFSALWYARHRRRYQVVVRRRGLYRLGPVHAAVQDPFGFVSSEVDVPDQPELLVYPRVVPLPAIGLPAERPFGDLRSANRLFPDPMRVAGVREYQPGDPLNHIHWPATAATGRLQVRSLEPSAQGGLAIFLNVWSYNHLYEGIEPVSLERGVQAAAAAAGWAAEHRYPVGLYANGMASGWGQSLRLPPAQGPAVLGHILEGLARLTPFSGGSIGQVLRDEMPHLAYGTAVLVISRTLPPDLAEAMSRARGRGHPVTLLLTGDNAAVNAPRGIRVYRYREEVAAHAPGEAG